MNPPETATTKPEAKKVNVAAKSGKAAAAQPRVPKKRTPRGLVLIRLSAPGAIRLASTNGFVTGWSTGATAVGGAAGRLFPDSRGPLSLATRSWCGSISTVTTTGGLNRNSPRVRQWGSTGANANEAHHYLGRAFAPPPSAARGRPHCDGPVGRLVRDDAGAKNPGLAPVNRRR
jgi:hypothetical protein